MENSRILLIDCADRKGLVHVITGVIFRSDLNIIGNHEFVDRETGRFFMRTCFSGELDEEKFRSELLTVLPDCARVVLAPLRKKDIVIMATREPHCLGDLLIRHEYNQLNARILAVIGNHETLRPLVEKFGLPFHHVPHEGKTREQHEAEIIPLVEKLAPDYIILAKYMRILTGNFVGRFKNRMINIHHSFLPAFIGASPYRQAFDRGVKIIGATAHFVSVDLDQGPIIHQGVTPVNHGQSVEDMIQAGRDVEKATLARALDLALADRIFVNGNKTIIFD